MKKLTKIQCLYPAVLLIVLPLITMAQDGISGILSTVSQIIGQLVPLVIGLAVLYFLWGVLQYVVAKDSEGQKEARGVMLMGIIVLFVMVSVWGLVNLLGDTLKLDTNTPDLPSVPILR